MSGHLVHGDWGGTRLRLFLLRDGQVVDRCSGPGTGMLPAGGIAGEPAASALRAVLQPWRCMHTIGSILLCGMAGSRNGIVEAAYAACPADAASWAASLARLDFDGMALAVAAGLTCTNALGAPDVMRGEETQIFGALALVPGLSRGRQTLVLPGTHSKWVTVEDGQVTGFHTYLTGEVFGLLCEHSSLLRADPRSGPLDEEDGFSHGLARAGSRNLLGALFEARSAQLQENRSSAWARTYLSGLLIGMELDAALDRQDGNGRVTIIATPSLARSYGEALSARRCQVELLDGDDCALAGLAVLEAERREIVT